MTEDTTAAEEPVVTGAVEDGTTEDEGLPNEEPPTTKSTQDSYVWSIECTSHQC